MDKICACSLSFVLDPRSQGILGIVNDHHSSFTEMVNMGNLENGVVAMTPDETLSDLEATQAKTTQAQATQAQATDLQRLQTLEQLKLLEPDIVPIFEEATQTAAHFLNAPICVLGLLERDRVWFKSAVGLSRIGLMNSLATSRQLPRTDAFCTKVAESKRILVVEDVATDARFGQYLLVQNYGIQAYLGAPLITANGQCIGALAIMSLSPRKFSEQDAAFLELMARWVMSEFERSRLQQLHSSASPGVTVAGVANLKANLLTQMTQDLCTPLTSILGMAKVLKQGIYASRPDKQQEYIQIIHDSGQHLLSLINEIVDLGGLDDQALTLNPIDIEMLCQQVISTLQQAAERREQQIQLSVEPGNRIWVLDKDRVRQILYHLVFSLIQTSSSESIIRLHVSRKQQFLNIAIWATHPWLGEGIPQTTAASSYSDYSSSDYLDHSDYLGHSASAYSALSCEVEPSSIWEIPASLSVQSAEQWTAPHLDVAPTKPSKESRRSLGIMLSQQLTELHSGDVLLQGSAEDQRYVVRLPQLKGMQG
jgi:signal transduction histidine kinase